VEILKRWLVSMKYGMKVKEYIISIPLDADQFWTLHSGESLTLKYKTKEDEDVSVIANISFEDEDWKDFENE